jgi:ADP-heptose:LPS heptosyltransferase
MSQASYRVVLAFKLEQKERKAVLCSYILYPVTKFKKKILILRFSSMGDIVLTSPVIRCLAQQIDAEIHYLTKTVFADLVRSNPSVQKVWTFDKEPDALFAALRNEGFDYIIDLHNNLRSLKVKWALRRPTYTFPKLRFARFMLVQFGVNMMPKAHIVERYMEAVKPLGVIYDGQGLDYFIPTDTTLVNDGLLIDGAYEVFAVGATHFTKRLPTERIITICQNRILPIVLIGGKQEAETGIEIAKACNQKVINLCGKLTLHQSALIVKHAQTVLTHDTGMMHIAAAFRKQIISFWGSTVHDLGFYPFYPDGIALDTSLQVEQLSCRPCTKFGRASCPKGHFKCMKDIDLNPIFQTQKQDSRQS